MKIKITTAQEKELNKYLTVRFSDDAINDWFDGKYDLSMYKELKKLSSNDFARVIIEGYEVEKTPEEKILETYNCKVEDEEYNLGYNDGIKFTLNTLGIEMKGINA